MMLPFKDLVQKWGLKITGTVHCGASIGQERHLYEEVAPGKEVIWIEAIPSVFVQLQKNIKPYPNHIAHNLCVSDVHGEQVVFHVSNNEGQSSSMLNFGLHTHLHPTVKFELELLLRTVRLDHFFDQLGGISESINFFNADLQGCELKALKGLGKYLTQFDYLILEVNAKETYEGCVLLPELDEFLSNYRRVETGALVGGAWSDALYVSRKLLPND